eukprot:1179139-Prorocentrum_minimum.AAC.2
MGSGLERVLGTAPERRRLGDGGNLMPAARLEGKKDPGGPVRAARAQGGNFKTKDETAANRKVDRFVGCARQRACLLRLKTCCALKTKPLSLRRQSVTIEADCTNLGSVTHSALGWRTGTNGGVIVGGSQSESEKMG